MQERTVAYELWTKAEINSNGIVEEPRAKILPSPKSPTLSDTPVVVTDLDGRDLTEHIREINHELVKEHGGVRGVEVVFPFGASPQTR